MLPVPSHWPRLMHPGTGIRAPSGSARLVVSQLFDLLTPPAGCAQITPDWERLTWHIEHDKETKERLGWVREMYAWSIGAALQASLQQQLFIHIDIYIRISSKNVGKDMTTMFL